MVQIGIMEGVVFSGYLTQSDGLPALGLRPWRQDPEADDFEEYWAEITQGLPDECCNALWEAAMASADPDPYPTNAAYHLVQGLSLLGDVYDESWERVMNKVVPLVLGQFGVQRGEWSAACAILQRVCSHLERRAEANLSELSESGSASVALARDVVLRESRKRFLEQVIISKHGLYRVYERRERPSIRAIQQDGDGAPSDYATHAEQGQAIAGHVDNEMAHAAITELVVQAADLIIKQLPPSREYAANPEEIDFLDWQKRANVFYDAASVNDDGEQHVTAAYYYMQSVYQLPENTIATAFNAARIYHALELCFASAFLQEISSENDEDRRDLEGQRVREEYLRNAFHMSLEQLQSSRPRELLGYALQWSTAAVHEAKRYALECDDPEKANQKLSPGRPSLGKQNQEDMFLFQRPEGSAHAASFLLFMCYRTQSTILSLCGRNLDALEAARLSLEAATRLENHEWVAKSTRLVSNVEQDIAEEEEQEGEDDDEEDEAEGDD